MIRTASGLILWYMKACGFQGWTSFWNVVYMAPGHELNQALIRHESKHLEQMQRDGKLLYLIKYSFWTLRYGYKMNPYEVEAREAEREPL
jgi:hypothetical protein